MPFVNDSATVRIELTTPGEWVDVRARLSQLAMARIGTAGVKAQSRMNAAGNGLDPSVDFDLVISRFAMANEAITGWSFEEPVTVENIGRLDPDDYQIIFDRMNELYRKRTPDERKN